MKRPDGGTADLLYVFGSFVADPVRGVLRRRGEIVALAPRTFEVLVALIERRGEVVEKDELLRRVWRDTIVEENNLARHISTLRKVFHQGVTDHEFIVTVAGRGYRFVATVQELIRADEEPYNQQPISDIEKQHSNERPTDEPVVPSAARQPIRVFFGLVASLLLIVSFTGTQALLPNSGERLSMPHRKLWQLTFSPGVQSEPTWSPDGRWIAYSSDRAGNSDVWVQPITEEDPVRLTSSAANDWQPAWSPDSKYVAFRSERAGGGLYVVPARGGTERKIADYGYRPQWSPDGSAILFYGPLRSVAARPTELYIVGLDGGPPRQVLADALSGFQAFQAAWYPEGQRISLYGNRRGSAPIFWTVSLNGRDSVVSDVSSVVAQRLKEADVAFGHFVWSPSANALFFEGTSEDVTNVWRISVEPGTLRWTGGPDRLTTGAERNADISLSSDGTKVAFSLRSETTRLWSLPFDAVAGRVTGPGVPFTAEGADAPYDVSLDGSKLVYRAIRQGKQELWQRSLVNGEDRVLLTAASISAPRWSPDGKRLIYRRDQRVEKPGSPMERGIAVMTSNGSEERRLTTPRPMNVGEQMAPFDWSADGTRVLSSCPTGQGSWLGICLFGVASGVRVEPDMQVIASRPNFNLFEPGFSPDGKWVCFNAVTSPGISTIYVAPTGGGEWTAISNGPFWEDKPRWAPDGRTIYFTSTRSGFVNVWGRRFDPAQGTPFGDAFPVTEFQAPSRMLLPRIMQLHIALTRKHLILPITDVTASLWVLDNVNR